MTSKAKNGAYKILASQKSAITKIAGVIMPEAVDNLENKIGGIFTILKSTHFDKGQYYSYLVCIIPEEQAAATEEGEMQAMCTPTRVAPVAA
jgi:hypothetical protein